MTKEERQEYMRQYDEIVRIIQRFFERSYSPARANQKAIEWMVCPNPLLGCRPNEMLVAGQFDKLKRFIETSLRENENPAADAIKAQQGAAK